MNDETEPTYQHVPVDQVSFQMPEIDTFNAAWNGFMRERERLMDKATGRKQDKAKENE